STATPTATPTSTATSAATATPTSTATATPTATAAAPRGNGGTEPPSPRLELRSRLLAAAPQLGKAVVTYRRTVATGRRGGGPRGEGAGSGALGPGGPGGGEAGGGLRPPALRRVRRGLGRPADPAGSRRGDERRDGSLPRLDAARPLHGRRRPALAAAARR